jgi:hypothetical protein
MYLTNIDHQSGALLATSILTVPMMILPARSVRQAAGTTIITKTKEETDVMSQIKQQWLWLVNKGKVTFPPVAAAAALANVYVAYALYVTRSDSQLARWYIVAAASTLSIGPFTALLMIPTYDSLERLAKGGATKRESQTGTAPSEKEQEQEKVKDEEFLRLLMKWARWNSVRALLPLTGAVVGLAAALH